MQSYVRLNGTVFLIDLLVGKVFGGSSVPGQDHGTSVVGVLHQGEVNPDFYSY